MNRNEKNKAVWSAIKTPHKSPEKEEVKAGEPVKGNPPQKPASDTRSRERKQGGRGNMSRRHKERPKKTAFTHSRRRETTLGIPPVETGVLRIIPLGGVEQVGQNMTALEYGNDIIIVDAGLQFTGDSTPGVDYIIPNTKYLEDRKENIRGMFITHGHLDHIGAIPFLIDKIGNPPIYSRQFGAMMILKRHEEFPHLPAIKMNIVEPTDVIQAGTHFSISSFAISHTIPDSMGLIIKTPLGDIAFIEDVRVDNIDGIPTQEEVEQYKRFANREMLLLTMDSTSIEKRGFSLSESVVVKNMEKLLRDAPSRIIIASFASQVERLVAIIDIADKLGKKVVIEGRSMKTNTEIAKQLGILNSKNMITVDEMNAYPPQKIVMLLTGGQGEEFAALARIANKSHQKVTLTKADTIILSSSIIPGNEAAISKLKDNLYRSEAKIVTYLDSDVHASGHGNREELKWIHEQIKYRFFMPVHGHHYMLRQHAELSRTLGTSMDNIIVPDNGSLVEIYDGGKKIRIRKEKAPSNITMVDGLSIGDVQDVVIRDRQMLAQDGMFVVIATIDLKTGKLRKSPDLISRGFVYLKENQELLRQARIIIKKTIEEDVQGMNPVNFDFLKGNVSENVSKFLFQKTAKRPLVIPVLLSV